jgi:prepilin-type N-terminal cleavage/methylation domain-containing protein
MQCKRAAFSMVELIFVIVVLGIVASIGSEMIAKVYHSYIVQRAQERASMKTELAATQIANRLASAIPGTVVRKLDKNATAASNQWEYLDEAMALSTTGDYPVLQWVGSDVEGFNFYDNDTNKTGWSGMCDVDTSSNALINTPGSQLTSVQALNNNLSGGAIPGSLALFFPNEYVEHNVTIASDQNLTLTNSPVNRIVEHYKLAWTSYALVVESGDLYLYYSFVPTPKVAVPDNGVGTTKRSLLMKNISTFKFTGAGGTIRFKICKEEQIGEDFNITACKEKAVF